MRKKKENPWQLREQNEGKETKEFVRPFYPLMLPALFLSILNPGLNCFGFALEFFPKLEPIDFSLIPEVADVLFLFALVSSSPGNTEQKT